MNKPLDTLMEHASQRLVDMDYLGSEALCLEGLAMARDAEDWNAYARVLLPLQECRRQRRMIAADTAVTLGTNACWRDPRDGCVAVTRPLGRDDALRIMRDAANHQRHVEVLWCDNEPDAATWTVRTAAGPAITCKVDAPHRDLINQRIAPDEHEGGHAAAHWFVAASEALGDAALDAVTAPLGERARVEQLEAMVAAVGDHEILHQRLADAARALVPQPSA
ncbi:MAG: hypothetical protein AAFX76_04565 [Planctomycetota bacterium]